MRESSQHTFQILTKRHERLAELAQNRPGKRSRRQRPFASQKVRGGVPSQARSSVGRAMNTSSNEASGAGYALAYREARRGLEDQERSVVELRARAGALIAAAA